ncbi:MAG: 2-oxo acid dehydrogenase subunit E2 [Candidatus Thorarchaeota archaeon]
MSKKSPKYVINKMPRSRQITTDLFDQAIYHHTIKALLEFDISTPKEMLQNIQKETNNHISFFGYFIFCLTKAINENKIIQGMKKGRKKILVFDDIDISTLFETEENWQKVPLLYVIREAQNKNLIEINSELQNTKNDRINEYHKMTRLINYYFVLPRIIRKIIIRNRYINNPIFRKKIAGTVCITSVSGMFGRGSGYGIPLSLFPLFIIFGGIEKKPVVRNDEIVIREILDVTVCFDHDIVDGAPAARFLHDLKKYVETGYGLNKKN